MKPAGIITAMVTPFKADYTIDYDATEKLVERLLAKGVHGIFILGTNGEFHVMKAEEKVAFAKYVVEVVDHRVPVYAGTGGNSTLEVIELSQEMAKVGVDALSVITPFFVGLTELELINHYQKIADAVTIPILLYNIPKSTGINLSPQVVTILADHSNIIGIKDSSGSIDNIAGYIEASKSADFAVLSGSDSLILAALKLGAAGAVAATSNVLTDNNLNIYRAYQDADLTKAQEWQESLEEFRRILKFGSIPSVLKQSIQEMGIAVGNPRLPVLPVTDEAQLQEIKEVIANYRL